MANVLKTANFILLWMGPLPLGLAVLSSILRSRPALIPVRRDDGWVPGRGR
jgi:hypothetical protein